MPHIDIDVPSAGIVASGSLLNQTIPGPYGSIIYTIFTTTTSGVYRVTGILDNAIVAMGAGLDWSNTRIPPPSTASTGLSTIVNGGQTTGGEATIFSVANAPLQVSVNGPISTTFDFHWVVEQLA